MPDRKFLNLDDWLGGCGSAITSWMAPIKATTDAGPYARLLPASCARQCVNSLATAWPLHPHAGEAESIACRPFTYDPPGLAGRYSLGHNWWRARTFERRRQGAEIRGAPIALGRSRVIGLNGEHVQSTTSRSDYYYLRPKALPARTQRCYGEPNMSLEGIICPAADAVGRQGILNTRGGRRVPTLEMRHMWRGKSECRCRL